MMKEYTDTATTRYEDQNRPTLFIALVQGAGILLKAIAKGGLTVLHFFVNSLEIGFNIFIEGGSTQVRPLDNNQDHRSNGRD